MEPFDILKTLNNRGYEAYIVGGFVRDTLLNNETYDVDITTNATPSEIRKIFKISTKDNFGSISFQTDSYNYDITTYRIEKNYCEHKPKITYTNSLEKDLTRRDFTINALCMDKDKNIFDYYNGQKDLNDKILRVVGNVEEKFTEDPLRMLRAIRFTVCLNFKLGKSEYKFIKNNSNLLKNISFTRKKEELDKIFSSKYVLDGLKLIKELNLDKELAIKYENINYSCNYLGVWSQIKYSNSYSFTKDETKHINNIRKIIKSKKIDKYTIFEYGYCDTIIASQILSIDESIINDMYSEMKIFSINDLKINGTQIQRILKVPASSIIQNIKKDLVINVLNDNINNNYEDLKKYILQNWK